MRLIVAHRNGSESKYESTGINLGGPHVDDLNKFYGSEGKAITWRVPGSTIELQLAPAEVESLIKELTSK